MGQSGTRVESCRWLPPRAQGFKRIFVPASDAPEAGLIPDVESYPIESISQLVQHLRSGSVIDPHPLVETDAAMGLVPIDFQEVKGQEHVKRALEVAAAGGHNLLMVDPPGAGKTLLARAMPGILPEMSVEEALDVTRIYSVADALPPEMPMIRTRPFRAPHHTISHAGLVGGDNWPHPGEISLVHRYCLKIRKLRSCYGINGSDFQTL